MKAVLLSILALFYAGVLCSAQLNSGCQEPFELIGCQTLAKSEDFCSVIGEVRKCFEEKAKCQGDFFKKFQEESEKALGVKCDACRHAPHALALTVLALALACFRGT